MKIENIIEDIRNDMIELSNKLEEQLKKENPDLNFSVSLPDIEELATIKSLALTIKKDNIEYYLSVHIHTHNGNRVFEDTPKAIFNNQPVPHFERHPFQARFVDLLRDIIKKKKNQMKSGHRPDDFLDMYNLPIA